MRRLALATVILFSTAFAVTPALAQSAQSNGNQGNSAANTASAITVPVAGAGGGSTFAGTFKLTNFAVDQGKVVANGLLSGVLTAANGATTSIVQTVSAPLQIGNASCDILHLDLGPLNLNLLGLQVSLNQIVLNITAQPGAGNLLGNLLCGVTNLLNNPSGLVDTLNKIIGAL